MPGMAKTSGNISSASPLNISSLQHQEAFNFRVGLALMQQKCRNQGPLRAGGKVEPASPLPLSLPAAINLYVLFVPSERGVALLATALCLLPPSLCMICPLLHGARGKAVKSLLGAHGSAPLTPSLTRAYYHTHLASDPVWRHLEFRLRLG